MTDNLEAQAHLVQPQVSNLIAKSNYETLTSYCTQSGRKVPTRLTVVDLQGEVLCDSDRDSATMKNHANRPEIMKAYQGDIGVSQRYSSTTKQYMLYVAVPVSNHDEIIGVLRTSIPLTAICLLYTSDAADD